ncbi:MAG: PIN domain-containing protein [Caulobacteraceae bacterium]
MTSVFVDSNVVVYTLDRRETLKRATAKAWLRALTTSGALTMSPQVTNEAYAVLTHRHGLHPVSDGVRDALVDLHAFVGAPLDFDVMLAAWQVQDRYRLRYWDALLLASANAAGCTHFLSEDLNDGQRYGAVTAVDPFAHSPQDVLGPRP